MHKGFNYFVFKKIKTQKLAYFQLIKNNQEINPFMQHVALDPI